MSGETIDHAALTTLAEAGVVRSAHVVGQEGGWSILVKYGVTKRVLATQRTKQVRVFRRLDTLVEYLMGVGISRFEVDASDYNPNSVTATKRPDRASAMKDAHAAAAYIKWLEVEIQEAIDDSSATVPHDEAMRRVRAAIKR
ncbi:MAG: hypothetical protein V4857_17815 [Pseudomonadota bacterium]